MAEKELHRIWQTIRRHNKKAADRMIRKITRATENLELFPLMGAPRDDLRPGLRQLVVEPYLIFYRITSTAIEITRVIHGARDLDDEV
jgi:toxin ParE1/3/4